MSPSFADLGVPADLVALLSGAGIDQPFPIQTAALPDALAGRDVCGRAPTGSGKTLAFGIAAVEALAKLGNATSRRPNGLVLVPTRELAAQVCQAIDPLARARRLRVAAIYGGTGYGPQLRALGSGVDMLVACPGRLEDLIERGDVDLSKVRLVVVDEADRMADMGFLPAVRRILDLSSSERQVLLFSATLDGEVDVLVRRYQHDPARHEVQAEEGDDGDVQHHFWKVSRNDRVALATQVVAGHESSVVFCRTRHGADRLARQLASAGMEAVTLHGSRTQAQRDRALKAFHDGMARALVATDVAARGIHVENVSCVVHFDPPADHKDYLHRSGRTGRAGNDGTVVSLVTPDQVAGVRSIQRSLGMPQSVGEPEQLAPVAPRRRPRPPARSLPAERPVHASPRSAPRSRDRDRSGPGPSANRRGRVMAPSRHGASVAGASTGSGRIKFYDPRRGFGFIAPDEGGRDVFVSRTTLSGASAPVVPGVRVDYDVRTGPKGPEATKWSPA